MVTIRHLGVVFFLLYGFSIPLLSATFVEENFVASLCMIVSCCVLSVLLYSGRALLLNILISFYVFKRYLTRPYVDIFLDKLDGEQLSYIGENSAFFTPGDAAVVYLSLLSLLLAWLLGLLVVTPKKVTKHNYWVFRKLDEIVLSLNWRLWLTVIIVALLTYQSPAVLWESTISSGSAGLVAYGLLSMSTVYYVCLAAFIVTRQHSSGNVYYILLVPIVIESLFSVAGGGRGALYNVFVFVLLYWTYLNSNRYITLIDIKRALLCALFIPLVIFGGLAAQVMRPLFRVGRTAALLDPGELWNTALVNLNVFAPDNPVVTTLYFGITQLLHRLGSLQAPMLILNDHYINVPWDTFNPLDSFMRTVNDLLPGTLFPDMIPITRLFHHIYFNEFVNYSSHMWSIQGTLYLYVGMVLSPIVVFVIAMLTGRYYSRLGYLARTSPAFATFFMFLVLDLIENGTVERVIPVDVVRPLASFFFVIAAVKVLYIVFPGKRRAPVTGRRSALGV